MYWTGGSEHPAYLAGGHVDSCFGITGTVKQVVQLVYEIVFKEEVTYLETEHEVDAPLQVVSLVVKVAQRRFLCEHGVSSQTAVDPEGLTAVLHDKGYWNIYGLLAVYTVSAEQVVLIREVALGCLIESAYAVSPYRLGVILGGDTCCQAE